jgi:hypothetical protein
LERFGVTTHEVRAASVTGSESGRFPGGYRHTALGCDDAMVLGVGEFGAEEQLVGRQVQIEASEAATWRSPEWAARSSTCPPMLRSSLRKWR